MGVRFPSVASTTIVASPALAAETVVCTTPPLNISLDFSQIILMWYVACLIGTAGVQIICLLRRGTTTVGSLVNVNANDNVNAGTNQRRSGFYVDIPGAVAGQQYSLTLTITSATAVTTVADVCLLAFAL